MRLNELPLGARCVPSEARVSRARRRQGAGTSSRYRTFAVTCRLSAVSLRVPSSPFGLLTPVGDLRIAVCSEPSKLTCGPPEQRERHGSGTDQNPREHHQELHLEASPRSVSAGGSPRRAYPACSSDLLSSRSALSRQPAISASAPSPSREGRPSRSSARVDGSTRARMASPSASADSRTTQSSIV